MSRLRRGLKYAGVGLAVLVALLVVGLVTGLLGVPTVDGVENRFAAVDDNTTTIDTTLAVNNPNPIGVSLGGLEIDYAIEMNGVSMAAGEKEGLSIGNGRSTVPFATQLNNERIPAWWYRHVDAGETTDVFVDVDVSHGLLGGRTVSVPQEQTIQTDIVGQFNDTTTRPIEANQPVISDPVLYVNRTSATYGEDLAPERTPLDMDFTVYNPKTFPYTVTEIGYTIEMNGIQVGEGSTGEPYAIPGHSERTLRATTVIQNERLDDWWVSHLERDQVTDLTIDFYLVVDPDTGDVLGETVEPIRLDVDQLDHETTIDTDIFGTKDSDGLDAGANASGSSGTGDDGSSSTPKETPTDGDAETSTETPTETQTETSIVPGSTESDDSETESDDSETESGETDTPTETAEDGPLPVGS